MKRYYHDNHTNGENYGTGGSCVNTYTSDRALGIFHSDDVNPNRDAIAARGSSKWLMYHRKNDAGPNLLTASTTSTLTRGGIYHSEDEDIDRIASTVSSPNELCYHHIDHATGYVNWLSGGRWVIQSTPGIFISEDIVSEYIDYNVGSQAVLSSCLLGIYYEYFYYRFTWRCRPFLESTCRYFSGRI